MMLNTKSLLIATKRLLFFSQKNYENPLLQTLFW